MSLQNENVRFVQTQERPLSSKAERPMETERITLSQRERDRLKVLHEVRQKQLTQVAAARASSLCSRSSRQVPAGRLERHGHSASRYRSCLKRRGL